MSHERRLRPQASRRHFWPYPRDICRSWRERVSAAIRAKDFEVRDFRDGVQTPKTPRGQRARQGQGPITAPPGQAAGSRASAEGTHLFGPLSQEEGQGVEALKTKGELDETEERRRVGGS